MAECRKRRILKREWVPFAKEFTASHRLRRATVRLGDDPLLREPGLPFVALTYDPQGGRAAILLGTSDPKALVWEAAAVERPRAIYIVEEEGALVGVRGLQIQQAPGRPMVRLLFDDEPQELVRGQWTADVAYGLYLQRGGGHGEDQRDWFEAEALIEGLLQGF